MKVSIHQPEHFPYLGFFQKIEASDFVVILDTVEFQGRRSFQARNRFLNSNDVEEWFGPDIQKDSYYKKINEVNVAIDTGWKNKLFRKLEYNFGETFERIYSSDKLSEINLNSIHYCLELLKIKKPFIKSSELSVTGNKSELLSNICKEVGATTYLSGQGAKDYMDNSYFDKYNIKVEYHTPDIPNNYSTLYNIKKGIV